MPPKLSSRDDPEQSKRFIDMARELEPADDPKTFERAFKTVSRSKRDAEGRKATGPKT